MRDPGLFEPADFSLEELAFMRDHLEETPTVALSDGVPKGVNPLAVRTALGRFTELDELAKVKNRPWCGYEPIRESIERFIAFQDKCLEAQRLGDLRHPGMYTFDSTGAAHRHGIGADSSEKVRTELMPDGTRVPFAVTLVDGQRRARVWGKQAPVNTSLDAITDRGDGTFHCSICDKVVTSYEVIKGRRARNKAIKQAREHCRDAKREISRHRAIMNVVIEPKS